MKEPYKEIARVYEKMRPSYPEALVKEIIRSGNLEPQHRLLDIGAGTGKATMQFAEKGFMVHAVEIGKDMAEVLIEKCKPYSTVSVDVASFEDWQYKDLQKFDLIYSAQAFHWIDKNVKYKKCHELLKDDGHLALFWYEPSPEKSARIMALDAEVKQIIEKYASDPLPKNPGEERSKHDGRTSDERKAEIEASGLFEIVKAAEYQQETRNSAEEQLQIMKSVPAFMSILDPLSEDTACRMEEEIKDAINKHGGYVSSILDFSLFIMKKK